MRDFTRGWARRLGIAATLGVVFTMIGIAVAQIGSEGGTDHGLPQRDPPPPVEQPAKPFDDGSDARLVDAATGRVSRIPDGIANVPGDCCYSVSPDGTRVAFVGMVGTDANDPWVDRHSVLVANVDGSEVRQLATDVDPNTIGTPQWAPGGTEIVYQRGSDGVIVVVDLATGVATTITEGMRDHARPTFGPDGRTILFTGSHRESAALWTVPVSGGSESVLLEPGASGTYSPDGTTIAYVWIGTKPVANTYRGIWFANADGGHPRRGPCALASCQALMGFLVGSQEGSRAAWSPGGTRIAASLADGGPVVVVNLRTKESRQVAKKGVPAWIDDHTLIIDEFSGRLDPADGVP